MRPDQGNPGGHYMQAPGLLQTPGVPANYHDPKRVGSITMQIFPGRYKPQGK